MTQNTDWPLLNVGDIVEMKESGEVKRISEVKVLVRKNGAPVPENKWGFHDIEELPKEVQYSLTSVYGRLSGSNVSAWHTIDEFSEARFASSGVHRVLL